MNILMIGGGRDFATGKRGAFYNTLEELHKHFTRIDVICSRVPFQRYNMSVFGNVYIHPSPWPHVFQLFWVFWKGFRLFQQQKYSVFTCHNPFSNGIGAIILHWITGVPYLLEIFHIEGYPRSVGIYQRIVKLWTILFARFISGPARYVRVMNKHEVPEFLTRHGVPEKKLLLVPAIYLDLKTFAPQDVQKQCDLVFVGRLARNKGLDLFLQIVERTRRTATIVGDGPLLQSAKQWARKHECKIHFHGFAKDAAEIARLINQSRLLLMTSLNEGGPRVVPEAMACGVPVVATPVGIVPDILPPECIEEWSVKDFSAKVMNLLSDPILYEHIRERGLFTVRQFERSTAVERYVEAIKHIAHAK